MSSIYAEGDPAGLVSKFDAGHLFWRHHCCVEYVNAVVCCIGEPQFSFIGRECYAVTWTAMSLRGAFLVAGHFHTMQHLSGFTVSYFKAEQLVDVDEAKRLAPIDGERTNRTTEWPDLLHHRVRLGVRHRKNRRVQARKIHA